MEPETGLAEHIQKFLWSWEAFGSPLPPNEAPVLRRNLKAGPFKPEYAGKVKYYLAAVDEMLSHPSDNPAIGLILCKGEKQLVVEYALRKMATPMGVAEFRHLEKLPVELEGSVPTIEEIEAELGVDDNFEG